MCKCAELFERYKLARRKLNIGLVYSGVASDHARKRYADAWKLYTAEREACKLTGHKCQI